MLRIRKLVAVMGGDSLEAYCKNGHLPQAKIDEVRACSAEVGLRNGHALEMAGLES